MVREPDGRGTAGDDSSITAAEAVSLNQNNLPLFAHRARNIARNLRWFQSSVQGPLLQIGNPETAVEKNRGPVNPGLDRVEFRN
jgi:hypothetical protein